MSKAMYVGIADKAHKVKKLYVGVDGIARKVKKAYIGVNGIARQFYSANPFVSYSGAYTVSDVTANGVPCKLYTFTGSGTLVLSDNAEYWMCGGGGGGGDGFPVTGESYTGLTRGGGGGGGGYTNNGTLAAGTYVVTIGAGGKAKKSGTRTTLGTNYANGGVGSVTELITGTTNTTMTSGDGASGGGGACAWMESTEGYYVPPGKGQGKSTCPFGATELKAHSAGGGGGTYWDYLSQRYNVGGQGGSNGSDGKGYGASTTTSAQSQGGEYGGGKGGLYGMGNATAATFYGGGGGGGYAEVYESAVVSGAGAAGYQGVVYLLIPA